jgi:putative ABC transport system ATP-binding protein
MKTKRLENLSGLILRTENLKKSYMTGRVKTQALRGINIDVKEGEFVAIIGPSGSGKTTLLNLAGILDVPTSGGLHIDGHNLSELRESAKTRIRLKKLGFVFQFFNLFPELTALENVSLPMMLDGKYRRDCIKQATRLLALVGLKQRTRHYPSELSGGEQQRVSIARALANRPSLILADEPTANLDSTTAAGIMALFRELNENQNETILMVTHEKEFAEQADRAIMLRDGLVVDEYRPDTYEEQPIQAQGNIQ